jgi:hypothetical protein
VAEFDSVIPAGGSGTLTAKIKTRTTQVGAVSKSVAVTTDSPDAQRVMLSVTFKSMPSVVVLPRPQMNLTGVFGDEPTATVIVRRPDGKKLEITGVESSDKRLVLTTKRVTDEVVVGRSKAQPGDVLVIAALAPDVAPVSANGRFKLRTNHPEAESLDVIYSLRLRPVIEARPRQLRLLLQEGNSTNRTALFRIQHNRQGSFQLTAVEPSNPELFRAEMVDGAVKQQVHTVAVMLQDEVVPGSLDGRRMESIVLATDDEAQPEIVIPVLIEPREMRRPSQPRPLE